MQNILIAWPNRVEGATLSGGSWSATLPISNLKTRFSYQPARTTNAKKENTIIKVALDTTRDIKCVALLRHNCGISATYRIRLSNTENDFTSPIWDSTIQKIWNNMYTFGVISWGDDGWWGGTPSAEDIQGYPTMLLCVLPEVMRAKYLLLEIFDEGNPSGYVEASRLWVSGKWQPSANASYGLTLGWNDSSLVEQALDGTEYFDERTKIRTTVFSLDYLSEDEGHSMYLEMQRQLGITKELLIVPDYDDKINLIRRSFVGRLNKLSPLDSYIYGLFKGGLEIKETV